MKKFSTRRSQSNFINSLTGEEDIIISTEDIIERINTIPELETKALASTLFLTGARLNEIRGELKFNQIREILTDDKKEFIHFINIKTEKKRREGKHPRTIPVPINDKYRPLINNLYDFIEYGNFHKNPEEPIFKIKDRNCRLKINKYLGINPQRLRVYRQTLLVREENFGVLHLVKFNNWSNSEMAKEYVKVNMKDLEDKYS